MLPNERAGSVAPAGTPAATRRAVVTASGRGPMAKYEISMDDPRELWEELYARIAAEAEGPHEEREEMAALEAAGVFFPAWHVL